MAQRTSAARAQRSSFHARSQGRHTVIRATATVLPSSKLTDAELLQAAAGVESCAVEGEGQFGRGLQLTQGVATSQAVCRVPLASCLLISDDPTTKGKAVGAVRLAVLCSTCL